MIGVAALVIYAAPVLAAATGVADTTLVDATIFAAIVALAGVIAGPMIGPNTPSVSGVSVSFKGE